MKNRTVQSISAAIVFILCISFSFAQTNNTGYINRQATSSAGKLILDPDGNNYTSKEVTGYAGNDVSNSEISFRSVPSFSTEPFGDLRRGPSHNYSDFVPDANNVGYYAYLNSANNFLFRFRMGSVMPGSKGYSVLLDTDGKFGATGANADPNYQAATTGTNGNPGFEIEIVLETNFRIAIYNIDGTSTPTLVNAYSNWQDMSQVSIAGTFDNGDPDFFIDFYIPFTDLQAVPFSLTTASSIRMSATTVMAPTAAIGGPKSDIYGLNDAGYKSTNDQYEAYINAQPSFTPTGLNAGSIGAMCTAAPTVNSPISVGTVNISGTWTKSNLSGAVGTATITVYKNGVSVGTVSNVASGSTWTLNSISVANNDVITAKAQAAGESMCLISNSVTASSCTSANRPAKPTLLCTSTSKGMTGTNYTSGLTIHMENLSRNILENSASNPSLFTISGSNWDYSSGCTGGSNMTSGSYKIYYTNAAGCVSEPVYICVSGNGSGNVMAGTSAVPTITSPANGLLSNGTKIISGTGEANATVTLVVDGAAVQTATANGTGSFTFNNLSLTNGQQVYLTNVLSNGNASTVGTSKCLSTSSIYSVSCYTTPPIINADVNSQTTAGSPITGISGEPSGTTIRVYATTNTTTPVATVTVQSNGTWTTGSYLAVAGTTYYATATNGSCGVSVASANAVAAAATTGRCGTINSPVTAGNTTISGTLTGSVASTIVNLYQDGEKIGTTTTGTNTWSITVNTATLPTYNGGVLTIGIQETGKQEQTCSASVTVSCNTGPATPNINPPTSSVKQGQTQTYTINNAVSGSFYGIADATTGQSLGTGVWANSSTVILTTNSVPNGSYTVSIKGTTLSGLNMCSSAPGTASLLVTTALPVTLIDFTAKKIGETILLNWIAENEVNTKVYEIEKSSDGYNYTKIADQPALNRSARITYSSTDEHSLLVNYYRLKIIDIDGKYSYSKVVVVSKNGVSSMTLQPNPFTSSFTVNLTSASNQFVRIQLLDISGRIVKTKSVTAVPGLNRVDFDQLASLQPGIYLIRVIEKDKVLEQKLIKSDR